MRNPQFNIQDSQALHYNQLFEEVPLPYTEKIF